MRNLFLLALNTLKITFRKKSNIIVYLILPVVIVIFVMSVYSSMDSKIKVGINNKAANGVIAKDFVAALNKQDKFKIQEIKDEEINNLVAEGKVDCVITIPANFDESVHNGAISKIQITAIKGQEVTTWVQNYVNYYVKSLMMLGKASGGDNVIFNKLYEGFKIQTLTLHKNVVKDESLDKLKTVQSIGFLIMFMLQGATTTSGLILKEKKEKTYFRIFTTPVNSRIYIGANIMANMCIMVAQSILVIFFSKYILKLTTGVPDLQLLAILTLFGFVCVTLGILLVAFSKTTNQVGVMATLIITPTCMLSGCFWPIELMSKTMQQIANFLPQTWALEAIRQLQNGKTFLEIMPLLGILVAFALAFFLIGMYKMKSNESVKSFI
ncbi:ABC transporter permease [Clostridium sp. CM028]|uniref:ABC transporter permease n=1 Tax=unclassified Clostridium TaxID=2614128 RepID=UPI001C6EC7D4|nr:MULTISPECIES: ABC transporter permease [unclassified Clostridium]MBW9145924.1 ABC transporter permease [Clostridium sp. CM027]MBW9149613.1 ABC transporter permease [Clostridium sp. CM028]UVE40901.1 ABC transporter permease [Clostridium sp. CM027]WLC61569.1 ABC transporter permease [Clostridium sp. CM028]